MDLAMYFSWNDTQLFRARLIPMWEGFHEKFSRKHWTCSFHGLSLDFTTKARQDLAGDFERLLLLQEVRKNHPIEAKVFIVDTPQFRYLRSLDPSAEFFRYAKFPIVSQANIYLDLIFRYAHNLVQMLRLLQAMLSGWVMGDPLHPRDTQHVPLIWDAIHHPELAVDPDHRYYPWIVDGERITKQDVLFILPQMADRKSNPQLYSSGYNVGTILDLYRRVPRGILSARIRDLMIFIARNLLPMPRSMASIIMTGYRHRTMKLMSAIEHVAPSCYITSLSSYACEDPSNVYLNSIGVETVMFCHSGTISLFASRDDPCDFREIGFANVLASRLIVWHEEFRKLIEEHLQDKTKVEVIGPLMAGEELVLQMPKEVLRKRLGVAPASKAEATRYISVFDIPPLSGGVTTPDSPSSYPFAYTGDYSLAFLRDMMRLLEDFENVALVFKPKRSMEGDTYHYVSEFHDLLEDLRKSGRGLVIGYDVNPWVPIALADLCIGMTFTSPPLAAIHHGIPGLFHDPTGIAVHHRYNRFSGAITHDYDQLRAKVNSLAIEPTRNDEDKELLWSGLSGFIGECPGTNSTDKFRELLSNIANKTS